MPPRSRSPARPTCRFCFQSAPAAELIRPCACTSKIHRGCLQHWREVAPAIANHCDVCKTPFVLTHDPKRIGKALAVVAVESKEVIRAAPLRAWKALVNFFMYGLIFNLMVFGLDVVLNCVFLVAKILFKAIPLQLREGQFLQWTLETFILEAFVIMVLPIICNMLPERYAPGPWEKLGVLVSIIVVVLVLMPLWMLAVVAAGIFLARVATAALAVMTVVADVHVEG
jgi:hypothetical protein